MAVIDASVWIAWFRNGDKFHEQAKHIIQIAKHERIVTIQPNVFFLAFLAVFS
jgi:predicted nucleic acid-binding protein